MKKTTKKLSINKETISSFNTMSVAEMMVVNGGIDTTCSSFGNKLCNTIGGTQTIAE